MKPFVHRSAKHEQGAALAVSLVVLLLVTMLGVTTMNTNLLEQKMATNYRSDVQAFNIAEAGIADALNMLNSAGGADDGFDDELQADGNSGMIIGNTAAFGADGGTYFVVATDNDDLDGDLLTDSDGKILLVSTATIGDATRTLEVQVSDPGGGGGGGGGGGPSLPYGIITNGDLEISGNPDLSGGLPHIHTNGSLTIGGTLEMTASGEATASGSVSGSPASGSASGAADPVTIPEINPADYLSYADYILHSDGTIEATGGNPPLGANDWSYSGGKWDVGDNPGGDGIFYIEGDAVIGGSPGGGGTPWQTTLVAEGSIEIGGNPVLQNYADPSHPEGIQNTLLIAGGDLKINGNPDQAFTGIMAAHEQLEISGAPYLVGTIIAEDAADVAEFVIENKISGDLHLTSDGLGGAWDDGGGGGGGGTTVTRGAWKRVAS